MSVTGSDARALVGKTVTDKGLATRERIVEAAAMLMYFGQHCRHQLGGRAEGRPE